MDVVGSLGSLKSPGGSSLGEDEIGADLTYLCFQILIDPLQYHNRCPQSPDVVPAVLVVVELPFVVLVRRVDGFNVELKIEDVLCN